MNSYLRFSMIGLRQGINVRELLLPKYRFTLEELLLNEITSSNGINITALFLCNGKLRVCGTYRNNPVPFSIVINGENQSIGPIFSQLTGDRHCACVPITAEIRKKEVLIEFYPEIAIVYQPDPFEK